MYLEEEGITIHTRAEVKTIREEDGMKTVKAAIDGESMLLQAEELLIATGVTPNAAGLGLEGVGVQVGSAGEVVTDARCRTSAEHIFAAGDVTGPPFLETVAAKEGHIAARNALTDGKETIDYSVVPHAVFTSPQVAGVGMTEEEYARIRHACSCRTVEMRYVPKARAINDTRGLIKMTVDPETLVIVGVHILAPLAAEMVHAAVIAVRNRMTIDELIDTVHVFPTLSEGIKLAAQAFRRDITRMSCCVE